MHPETDPYILVKPVSKNYSNSISSCKTEYEYKCQT